MVSVMNKKKLMLLGGIRYLIPVIEKAHELGLYVITCDYLPDNTAHKYSDQYVNVSIIDKEAVLSVAEELQIDGIMSFGCDPGVVSAAYVAEKMELPFQCSYSSACILQNKGLFRKFLTDNGFNTPRSISFCSMEDACSAADDFVFPVIVKPVDSAGSKGVSKVSDKKYYQKALENAFDNSFSKVIIVEEFLDVKGYQSSTDMFTVNGKLVNPLFSDQYFDNSAENPFVPIIETWPTTMPVDSQNVLIDELNRLFALLECRDGIYNIECRLCTNGKAYIMEVSPRGGGNNIALAQDMAYGLNFIENEIRKAIGMPLVHSVMNNDNSRWMVYTVHSKGLNGRFKSLNLCDFQSNVKHIDLAVSKGKVIEPLKAASQAIGDIILRFQNEEQMKDFISNTDDIIEIENA